MKLDSTEFRRLLGEHQRMVYSLALRVSGDTGVAEEIAQDVFLELHRTGGERLQSEDHVRFWLRRVTIHRATDALRRQAVRPEAWAEEWDEAAPGPQVFAVSAQVEARLEELVGGLPPAMRIAVVLRYQEDMLPPEIAELLQQPLATVKSNLQRGLNLLRRKAAVTLKEYVRG